MERVSTPHKLANGCCNTRGWKELEKMKQIRIEQSTTMIQDFPIINSPDHDKPVKGSQDTPCVEKNLFQLPVNQVDFRVIKQGSGPACHGCGTSSG